MRQPTLGAIQRITSLEYLSLPNAKTFPVQKNSQVTGAIGKNRGFVRKKLNLDQTQLEHCTIK
jgi:hypothetical protein